MSNLWLLTRERTPPPSSPTPPSSASLRGSLSSHVAARLEELCFTSPFVRDPLYPPPTSFPSQPLASLNLRVFSPSSTRGPSCFAPLETSYDWHPPDRVSSASQERFPLLPFRSMRDRPSNSCLQPARPRASFRRSCVIRPVTTSE